MAFTTAPAPVHDPIADRAGRITKAWIDWFSQLTLDVDAAPARVKTVTLTGQGASIGTTSIPAGSLAAGLYRVSWRARITQAATVSSSLTVTVGHTESSLSLTQSGAAMTGNTTTTVQSGDVLVRIDGASPVTYSTTYASAGATAMQYRLDVVLESVEA